MHVRRAVVSAAAFTLIAAAPAAAHTELLSSDPAEGATLTAPPTQVALTFGEDLLTAGDKLVAQDAQGTKVDLGPSQVDGAVLSAPWPATAAAGQYRVSYRAVAEDGHPLEGTISFTIKGDAAPEVSPSPAAQQQSNDSSSAAKIWAPIALLAALLIAGGLFWRSRAN